MLFNEQDMEFTIQFNDDWTEEMNCKWYMCYENSEQK